jgi:hypothetical protein
MSRRTAARDPLTSNHQKRFGGLPSGVHLTIEISHEFRSRPVGHTPQGYQKAAGTSGEKGMRQADHSFSPHPAAECRLAGRKADELGAKPEASDTSEVQPAAGEHETGLLRTAITDLGVGGEVQIAIPRRVELEPLLYSCLASRQEVCATRVKEVAQGARFLLGEWQWSRCGGISVPHARTRQRRSLSYSWVSHS